MALVRLKVKFIVNSVVPVCFNLVTRLQSPAHESMLHLQIVHRLLALSLYCPPLKQQFFACVLSKETFYFQVYFLAQFLSTTFLCE